MAKRFKLVSDLLLSVGLGLLVLNAALVSPQEALAGGDVLAGNCDGCTSGCTYNQAEAICKAPAGTAPCSGTTDCDGTCTCKPNASFGCPCT